MTVFVAAVALALSGDGMEARVSYVTPGATLAKVAQDLSDQTGVKILPGPGMEREIVVLHIDRQPLSEVLPRLANVVQGKSVEVSDTLRIDFDISPFEARQEAARQETRAYLPELRRLINEQTDEEPEPAYLVLRQFIAGVTDDQIIDSARREVSFSTDPYPGQRRAPRIDPLLIQKWLDQEAPVVEPEEPIDQNSDWGRFLAAYRAIYGKESEPEPMPAPTKLVFEIDQRAERLTILVLDRRVRTIASETFYLVDEAQYGTEAQQAENRQSLAPPWPSDSLVYEEPEDARLTRELRPPRVRSFPEADRARLLHMLPRLADFDPFVLLIGDRLVEIAKTDDMNLLTSEFALGSAAFSGRTRLSTTVLLTRISNNTHELRERPWWVIKPDYFRVAAPSSYDRVNEQEFLLGFDWLRPPLLAQLLDATAANGSSYQLDVNMRRWARLGTISFQEASRDQQWLPFLSELSGEQRAQLFRGGRLRIADFSPGARLALEAELGFGISKSLTPEIKFLNTNERARGDEEGYMGIQEYVPSSARELQASGLLDQGTLQAVSRVKPGLLLKAGEVSAFPAALDAYAIAEQLVRRSYRSTAASKELEDSLTKGYLCDIREYRFRLTLAPGYGLETTLVEVLNIRESTGGLPQELREAIARERELLSANPLLWPDEDGEKIPPPPTFSLGIR